MKCWSVSDLNVWLDATTFGRTQPKNDILLVLLRKLSFLNCSIPVKKKE